MTDTLEGERPAAPVRERHRPVHFVWHGDRYAFHRLEDGMTLARLDPYVAYSQRWKLLSGRVIEVTGAEVRDITKQVHDLDLPDTRPEGSGISDWDEARIRSMEDRLAALEARPAPEPQIIEREVIVEKLIEDPALREENDMLRSKLEHLERAASEAASTLHSRSRPVEGGDDLEGMPAEFGTGVEEAEAEPGDGIPESFRGLMVDDDTPEKFTERMRRRWQYLQHLRIDGGRPTNARSLPDMTPEEDAELTDLEARNKASGGTRWLQD